MRVADLPTEERAARAVWSRICEPCDERVVPLLRAHPSRVSALQVLATCPDPRLEVPRERLMQMDGDQDREVAERVGARVLIPGDEEWPDGLDDLGEGAVPHCLWVRGPLHLADSLRRSVAVVGSRAATDYGRRVAAEISGGMVDRGFTVLSGAAFGIDAAAHRAALAQEGATVAVLACGVDRPYPAAHERLLAIMADQGAVVSELPPGCVPHRHRFLLRNRLIAALTRGTVVVEAGLRSGALSTARRAADLGRPLGAVPGPVSSAASAGCHQLVRDALGVLVTDAAEVAELVGDIGADLAPERRGPVLDRDRLPAVDQRLLTAMPYRDAQSLATVARTAALSLAEARAAWTRLEQAGYVESVGGLRRLSARARAEIRAGRQSHGSDG